MPGVPSGRGCEACRKQKKKCDQLQPACSRCTRLRIQCVGSGQRRFKFMEETPVASGTKVVVKAHSRFSASPSSGSSSPEPPFQLSNRTSKITAAFVARLEVNDPRYSILGYGEFLSSLPCRLGQSKVLDASVNAFCLAWPAICQKRRTAEAYGAFAVALKALRGSLENPSTAQASETLCAMYLIMIMQGWLGGDGDLNISHGEAITHILQVAAWRKWESDFEAEMLLTLCVTSIFESVCNPKIELEPWLSRLIDAYVAWKGSMDETPFPSLTLRELGKIPGYTRNPEAHAKEIAGAYKAMLIDMRGIRRVLHVLSAGLPVPPLTKAYAVYQSCHGVLLCLMILANCILRIFDPLDVSLLEDRLEFHNEIILLGHTALAFRPLGATYVPLCLGAAWAATESPAQRAEILELISFYKPDLPSVNWQVYCDWLEDNLNVLRLRAEMRKAVNIALLPTDDQPELDNEILHGLQNEVCCIL